MILRIFYQAGEFNPNRRSGVLDNFKLNVGASPIWSKSGWFALDHKASRSTTEVIAGTATNIDLPDNACSVIFCSHMFEHIPHTELKSVVDEFYRVLHPGGVLRILTPDLKKIATAYVNNDMDFYAKALSEDENLRTDLGMGGTFMNFIVSSGQDTALFTRTLDRFISGYAHLYCYDFEMLKLLFSWSGFTDIQQKEFCQSDLEDFKEPLHVESLPPVWEDMNKDFYKRHNLTHYYDENDKQYHIDFTVTGFDRDPLTSLIVECRKMGGGSSLAEATKQNYDRYGKSLLGDTVFAKRHELLKKIVRDEEEA